MTSVIGNSYSYNSVTSNPAGKLYVPVSKSALIYSHFDHVSGVAAKSGQNGVSITKIQILNSILDHLSAIKNEPKNSITDISNNQADALIKDYQQKLQQAVKQTPYVLNGAQPQAGSLFQIDA